MRIYELLIKIALPIWPVFDTQCQLWPKQGFELAVPVKNFNQVVYVFFKNKFQTTTSKQNLKGLKIGNPMKLDNYIFKIFFIQIDFRRKVGNT